MARRWWARHVRTHQHHVWYELDLRGSRPRRDLPDGFALRAAEDSDLPLVAEIPMATSAPILRDLQAEGHDLWVVKGGGHVAFVCWIFRGRAPVAGIKGGWLGLPSTIVCLEDSLTAPEFRGRGIAPGAWCAIADRLEREGVQAIVTKIEDWNTPSRVAVGKAGFVETADMTLDREWGRSRVAVFPNGDGNGQLLAELINERPNDRPASGQPQSS